MPSKRCLRGVIAGALLAGLTTAAASAQLWDKRTFFTFSGPVAVPGVTLPAGEYMFRLVDTTSRHVIHVTSASGAMSYAMFFGIHAQRSDVPSDPEVRFMETAEGMPTAIDTWWYPGQRSGWEFIYPKEQARRLMAGTGRSLVTTVEETTTPAETAETELTTPPVYEREPYTGPVAVGEVAPPEIQVAEPAPEALPKTASRLPLAGAGALVLLLGAAFVRAWRRAIE